MENMDKKDYAAYEQQTAALLKWYDENRRILPWREDPQPYHVWLSEIMLQQTRVDTVIDYYHRFLKELPDVKALAEAEEELLLKLWQGLGYYSRIRNMHKASLQVMEDFGGKIPSDPKELQKLSGIGPYAAAAIASIAFGVPVPSVDGNLLRVFARTTGYEDSIRTPAAKKLAESHYRTLLPEDRPGDMNQALMDLGAKIEKRTIFLIEDGSGTGRPAYGIRKRPAKGLLANLWEFPGARGHLTEKEACGFCEDLGFQVKEISSLPKARHIFSHVEWDMIGYRVRIQTPVPGTDLTFATKEEMEQNYSIPTAFSSYYRLLD